MESQRLPMVGLTDRTRNGASLSMPSRVPFAVLCCFGLFCVLGCSVDNPSGGAIIIPESVPSRIPTANVYVAEDEGRRPLRFDGESTTGCFLKVGKAQLPDDIPTPRLRHRPFLSGDIDNIQGRGGCGGVQAAGVGPAPDTIHPESDGISPSSVMVADPDGAAVQITDAGHQS